jgi:uncharacterized Zn-binding protein involved in type VI secretion
MSRSCQRLGDLSKGHCFPPRPNIGASSNVFINGRGAHRLSDPWPTHCCGDACHASISIAGSTTVFVNRLNQVRVCDAQSCGDSAAFGSPNVFAGG